MDILPASVSNEDNDILHSDRKRVGRPNFHEMFPDLILCVENYIQQNTASAHLRRREGTMYLNGVTLNDITRHVKKELGIEVSQHTIHHLLRPKRTGTTTSKRFKSLINACVPPKNNSGEKRLHPHFHYMCAQINIVNEWLHCVKGGHYGCQLTTKIKLMLALLLLVTDARYGHFVYNRMHQHISIMIFHTRIVS